MRLSEKKKVALVNVFFAPQAIGGATRVLMDNVDVLLDQYGQDYDLVGFTSDHDFQPPHTVEPYIYRGMRVYRAGIIHRVNMDWHPHDDGMRKVFARFLELEKPDVVHFHCIQRLTASIIEAVRSRGIPYVVTVHDAWWISDFQFLMDASGKVYPNGHPDPFVPVEPPEGISLEESINRRAYLKDLLNNASQVMAVSEAFAHLYAINGVHNVVANRNGISPRVWPPKIPSPSGKIRLAHIGGMSAHKGYHLFKEALHKGRYSNLEALVVDHSKPDGYEARDWWGDVPVTFIGKVPQRSIGSLYARMDVLVAPSIWPESYGLVTREATAAGVWVVASNIGGIGEDIIPDRTGVVISPSVADLQRVFQELDARSEVPAPDRAARDNIRQVKEQVSELVEIYNRVKKEEEKQ